MKKLLIVTLLILLQQCCLLAQQELPALDKSPLDMCYYPSNFPMLKIRDKATEPLVCRVIYSRPNKESRIVFGDLVKFGEVWRLGANEATEIEFYKAVTIGGKKIGKGKYTLYAIAADSSWNFIVNKETDTWGSFKYDVSKDVARVEVPVQTIAAPVEALVMTFEKADAGNINLIVAWDKVKVAMPINIQ